LIECGQRAEQPSRPPKSKDQDPLFGIPHGPSAQVFQNLQAILTHLGATQSDVVKINYYVVGLDAERLGIIRTARNAMFNLDPKPASTLIGVANLFKPEALIEIEMVVRAP